MLRRIYSELGNKYIAYLNCVRTKNTIWEERWKEEIEKIVNTIQIGSGIDAGITFNFNKSKPYKLVLDSSFHQMDEMGGYDRWIDFSIIVTPSWNTFDIVISGRFPKKYEMTRDYLTEYFIEEFEQIYDDTAELIE
jgi:hypothetical protein